MVLRLPAMRFARSAAKPIFTAPRQPICLRLQRRYVTADEKPLPKVDNKQKVGPNQNQLPHVSEEAAALGKITGDAVPELDQGTLVDEVEFDSMTRRIWLMNFSGPQTRR